MKISVVLCGRNDNYGGFLNERATYSINSIIEQVDEVIYVDWNGEDKPLTDVINIKDRSKLKLIVVSPKDCKELMGQENYTKGQKMCEVLARNIGLRRATGDIIISSNIDIIFPKRYLIEHLITTSNENEMITLTKHDVNLQELDKQFHGNLDVELLPVIYGLNSIKERIMSPYLKINKEMIEQYPEQAHHNLASIICACGDFQMAHRSMWHKIKGFEESGIKRSYTDTQLQYKVIMSGGTVRATTFPPVYHIDHERDNSPALQNSMNMVKTTNNSDNWGFYEQLGDIF